MRFIVLPHLYFDRDALLIVKDTPTGPMIGKLVWEQRHEGFMIEPDDAAIRESRGTLQKLAAALEEAGVSTGTSAELRATKGWLEDMRALAFKQSKPR